MTTPTAAQAVPAAPSVEAPWVVTASSGAGDARPLAGTAQRVSALAPWFDLVVPGADGALPPAPTPWRDCDAVLSGPTTLRGWQEDLRAALLRRDGGPVPRLTVEAWVRAWYLCVPAYAGGLSFALDRRVPRLGPSALAVGVDDGRPARVALLDPRFACLPDDPSAASPLADVLPDERALAARLRAEVVAHAGAFLAVEPRSVRRGPRQLWGAVLDALDGALSLPALLGGDVVRAVADAHLALPGPEAPLPSGSTCEVVDADVAPALSRARLTCCYNDKLPGQADALCDGCPRALPR